MGNVTRNSLPAPEPLATGLDAATVHGYDAHHQVQSDSKSLLRTRRVRFQLMKRLENIGDHVPGDADAVVPHGDPRRIPFGGGRDVDRPVAAGAFDGIVQDVAEHLREPGGIAFDRDPFSGHGDVEPAPCFVDHGLMRFDRR